MQKKSRIFKKMLSLVLAFVMVCGMMVFTANAADSYSSLADGKDVVVKGVIEGIGTTTDDATTANHAVTKINLSELTAGKKIKVHYYIYLDSRNYDGVYELAVSCFGVPGLTRPEGSALNPYKPASPADGNELVVLQPSAVRNSTYNQNQHDWVIQNPDYAMTAPNYQEIAYKWQNKNVGLYFDFVTEYTVSSNPTDIETLKTNIKNAGAAGYVLPLDINMDAQNKIKDSLPFILDAEELAANPNNPELATVLFDGNTVIPGSNIKLMPAKIAAEDENALINYDFGQNKFNPADTFPESRYKDIIWPNDQDYTVDPDFNGETVYYYDNTTDKDMVLIGWDTDGDGNVDYEPGGTIPAPAGDITLAAVYDEVGLIGPGSKEIQITFKLRNTGLKDDTKGLVGNGIVWPMERTDVSGRKIVGVKVSDDKYSATVAIPKTSDTQTTGTITSGMYPVGAQLKTSTANPKENWLFEGYFTNEVDENGQRFYGTNNTWGSIANKSFTDGDVVYIYLTNGTQGDDVREPIDLVITYPDETTAVPPVAGKTLNSIPKDIPYEIVDIYGNPVMNSQGQPSAGTAVDDPADDTRQRINLTEDDIPAIDYDRRPVAMVEADPVDYDGDGVPDIIRIIVTYDEPKVPLVTNNPSNSPVIDDTDYPYNPDDPVNPNIPLDEPVDRVAVILFVSEDQLVYGWEPVVRIADVIDYSGTARIPANVYPIITDDSNGNPFLNWIFKGDRDYNGNSKAFAPDPATYGASDPRSKEFYYIMEAEFENKAKLTVNNVVEDKDDGTTKTVPVIGPNLEVDPGTYVKVVDDSNNPFVNPDDNNKPAVFGSVNTDSTWEIPEGVDKDVNEKVPRKGDKIFDGDYEPDMENGVPKIYDENGEKVIYVRPVYADPDEVVILPLPVDEERDGLTTDGKGYTVLKGAAFANDMANIRFRVAFKGANGNLVPAEQEDISKLSRVAVNDKKFAKFTTRSFGQFVGDILFDKVEDGYGVFLIKYQMHKSAVVRVTMSCTVGTVANAKSSSNDHYVITTGDFNGDVRVTSVDASYATRVFYNDLAKPKKASEITSQDCDFTYELLDMNKDGRITSVDSAIISRMFYKDINPSN